MTAPRTAPGRAPIDRRDHDVGRRTRREVRPVTFRHAQPWLAARFERVSPPSDKSERRPPHNAQRVADYGARRIATSPARGDRA
jgi:hypothetical protein